MKRSFISGLIGLGIAISAHADDFEQAPINYSKTAPADPVSNWQDRLAEGSLHFDQSSERGFVASVLAELKIPVESQMLVYSKTSLQIDRISPRRPRALYFSDEAYVGWVQGGDLEITSMDPVLGPIFYRLTVPLSGANHRPRVIRSRDCLSCHASSRTGNVPGMLVRSVRADTRGFPLFSTGTFLTEPSSPIKERWGGWYVTGSSAGPRHMGNLIFDEVAKPEARVIKDLGTDHHTLDGLLRTDAFLTNTSDIVALMVMEHQIAAHNALTKAHYTTRKMLHHHRQLAKHWGEEADELSATTKRIIASQADQLLKVMLFADEFALESWGVEGSEAFQTAFVRSARRSAEGRSLRDFELLSRLFKHRLSYTIYSRSFDVLPKELKTVFYDKLFAALSHPKAHPVSEHLSTKDADRILTILQETKEDLPTNS